MAIYISFTSWGAARLSCGNSMGRRHEQLMRYLIGRVVVFSVFEPLSTRSSEGVDCNNYEARVSFDYKIHHISEHNLTLIRLYGTIVTDALYDLICEAHALKDALSQDGTPPIDAKVVCDLSQVTGFDGGFQDLSNMLGRVWRHLGDGVINANDILVAPDETIFGVARMFQQIVDSRNSSSPHIAQTMDEASALAGVDPGWVMEMIEKHLDASTGPTTASGNDSSAPPSPA